MSHSTLENGLKMNYEEKFWGYNNKYFKTILKRE